MNGTDCSSSKMSWSSFQRITADSQEDDVLALATSKKKEGTRIGYMTIILWLLLYHYFPNLPSTCAWHWKLTSSERCTGEEKLTTNTCHKGSTLIHSSPLDSRTSIHQWLQQLHLYVWQQGHGKMQFMGTMKGARIRRYLQIHLYKYLTRSVNDAKWAGRCE